MRALAPISPSVQTRFTSNPQATTAFSAVFPNIKNPREAKKKSGGVFPMPPDSRGMNVQPGDLLITFADQRRGAAYRPASIDSKPEFRDLPLGFKCLNGLPEDEDYVILGVATRKFEVTTGELPIIQYSKTTKCHVEWRHLTPVGVGHTIYLSKLKKSHTAFSNLCQSAQTGAITPAFYSDQVPIMGSDKTEGGGAPTLDSGSINDKLVFAADNSSMYTIDDEVGWDQKTAFKPSVPNKWRAWKPEIKEFGFRIGTLLASYPNAFALIVDDVFERTGPNVELFEELDTKTKRWEEDDKLDAQNDEQIQVGVTPEQAFVARQQMLDRRVNQDLIVLGEAVNLANTQHIKYLAHMCLFVWRMLSTHNVVTLKNYTAGEAIAAKTLHWTKRLEATIQQVQTTTRVGVTMTGGAFPEILFR